jgi:hypothetical protein
MVMSPANTLVGNVRNNGPEMLNSAQRYGRMRFGRCVGEDWEDTI